MFGFSSIAGFFIVVPAIMLCSILCAYAVVRLLQWGREGGLSVPRDGKNTEKIGRSRVKLALIGLVLLIIIWAIISAFTG